MSRNNVDTTLLYNRQAREVEEWHQAHLSGTMQQLSEVTGRMVATEDAIAAIEGVYTDNITKVGGCIDVKA